MLGHVQKVNHFWAQIKKTQKLCELGRFAQSPSNISIIIINTFNNK